MGERKNLNSIFLDKMLKVLAVKAKEVSASVFWVRSKYGTEALFFNIQRFNYFLCVFFFVYVSVTETLHIYYLRLFLYHVKCCKMQIYIMCSFVKIEKQNNFLLPLESTRFMN